MGTVWTSQGQSQGKALGTPPPDLHPALFTRIFTLDFHPKISADSLA